MKIVTSLIFTFLFISTQAQRNPNHIVKVGWNKYTYQETNYTGEELGVLLDHAPNYQAYHSKAMKRLNNSKSYGYLTIGIYSVGGIGFLASLRSDRHCDAIYGPAIGILSWFFIGPITGTIALINHTTGSKTMKRLISEFNRKDYDSLGRVKEQPSLHLASHGGGLQIRF